MASARTLVVRETKHDPVVYVPRDDVHFELEVYRLESEMIESLRRLYYFSKRISKLVIEETAPYGRDQLPSARRAISAHD